MARLERNPTDAEVYRRLGFHTPYDRSQRIKVIEFAAKRLPLCEMAAEPSFREIPGDDAAAWCVLWLVQSMNDPETYNDDLMAAAIASPYERLRSEAVSCLISLWCMGPKARSALRRLFATDFRPPRESRAALAAICLR